MAVHAVPSEPGSGPKFPANREKYREKRKNWPFETASVPNRPVFLGLSAIFDALSPCLITGNIICNNRETTKNNREDAVVLGTVSLHRDAQAKLAPRQVDINCQQKRTRVGWPGSKYTAERGTPRVVS